MAALHPRFQRFMRFALGTGCRLDEIRGIRPEHDIDRTRGTAHVIGKFRKERDVPMQPDAHLLKEDLVAASQQVKIPVASRGGAMGSESARQPYRLTYNAIRYTLEVT